MPSSHRRRRRALKRITPGTGRPLKPFHWWQGLSRALFTLTFDAERAGGMPGEHVVYTVDVPYWQRLATEDGEGKAHLFRDGVHEATSTFPAAFPVPGGVIEVRPSTFGLRRCHYVPEVGPERQLTPDPRSPEGRQAALRRKHPLLSGLLGLASLLVLLAAAALAVPQLIETLTAIPPVAERVGTFTSPIDLPWWENVIVAVIAAGASTERATRLRYSWLDALAQE